MDPPNAVAMQGVIGRYVSLTVGTDVEALHGHNDKGAAAVRWNPEGSLMVSGGDDGSACFELHGDVTCLLLAGSVRIWDVHGVECAALQLDRRAYGAVPEVSSYSHSQTPLTVVTATCEPVDQLHCCCRSRLWNGLVIPI